MKKTRLDLFNNNWYRPGGTIISRLIWYLVNVLFFLNPLNPLSGIKVFFLKLFGAKVGRNVVIKPGVNIKYPWLLTIGDNVWLGEKVWIDNLCSVVIGNNVCVSQGALLLTGNHNYKKVSFDLTLGNIVLEEGVWIGAHAIVCPNVTCKSHSILTVNSVATSELKEYSIYQGNPAVRIRERIIY